MKHTFRCLLIILAAASLAGGCKKETISATGTYQDAVYFLHRSSDAAIDSLTFSFVAMPDSIKSDTVWLPVRIAGNVADHDRQITLTAVDTASTAKAGTHYKLLDYSMPKGALAANLGVVLYRTPEMRDSTLFLTLRIQPDSDFPANMKDTVAGIMAMRNVCHIAFSDQVLKPTNWDSFLVYLFGKYSKVKMRFIVSVTGRTTFPTSGTGAFSYADLLYFQGITQTALAAYEAENGPMIDENGNTVSIP